MKKLLLFFVIIMGFFSASHAQRLITGQRGLQFSFGLPVSESKLFDNGNFIAGISLTINHKRANHWLVGLEYSKKHFVYRPEQIPVETFVVEGGYMVNLFADAGKNLLLNSGVSAVGGYEVINRSESLLYDGATLMDKDSFVYGGAYHVVLDMFVTDNLILFIKGKCNVLWNSDVEMFRPQIGIGIRIVFKNGKKKIQ